MTDADVQGVREVLQKFQDGYVRRDSALVDDFRTLFVAGEELEVIGTGGINPGDDEWCLGPEATSQLVKNDWEGWGDLTIDVEHARIYVMGDVAWLATTGSVKMVLKRDETYANYLQGVREALDNAQLDARGKLLEIMRGSTNTFFEAERGENYLWPIRFTAVLVRSEASWLFHQMQFSFATTRFPDVRNV